MKGYGMAAFSSSCQDLLTGERKVDDSKVFGLANWKDELAIYGDGGRLGRSRYGGRYWEFVMRHVKFETPIRHPGEDAMDN